MLRLATGAFKGFLFIRADVSVFPQSINCRG
jgi:hypothetical protein